MRAALTAFYALLKLAWPTGAVFLHPDTRLTFEQAMVTARASGSVVVRYYQPQEQRSGTQVEYLCFADVCHETLDRASLDADKLLIVLRSTARAPNAIRQIRATHLRESSYERISVSFTLVTDSSAVPLTPDEPEGS